MPAKKAPKRATKRVKKSSAKRPISKSAARKNPKGGLTAKGRAYFAKTEGSHLKAGVTGDADTPEKMRRKGSFLRRFFTHLRGPLVNDNGEPTRLALSAHAWGEPVPKTAAAAKRLAAKGEKLLARYAKASGASTTFARKKSATKRSSAKKSGTRKSAKKQR